LAAVAAGVPVDDAEAAIEQLASAGLVQRARGPAVRHAAQRHERLRLLLPEVRRVGRRTLGRSNIWDVTAYGAVDAYVADTNVHTGSDGVIEPC
jgi:hypothetical protein